MFFPVRDVEKIIWDLLSIEDLGRMAQVNRYCRKRVEEEPDYVNAKKWMVKSASGKWDGLEPTDYLDHPLRMINGDADSSWEFYEEVEYYLTGHVPGHSYNQRLNLTSDQLKKRGRSLRVFQFLISRTAFDKTKNALFHWALWLGMEDLAHWIFEASVEKLDFHRPKASYVVSACVSGNIGLAEWIWSMNPQANLMAESGEAFHHACYVGDLPMAQWIWIKGQIQGNPLSIDDPVPLTKVVNYCHSHMIPWLLFVGFHWWQHSTYIVQDQEKALLQHLMPEMRLRGWSDWVPRYL